MTESPGTEGPGTDGPVRWGAPARLDRTDRPLLGRERETRQIHDLLDDPAGPSLILVRGERGVGRSAFLDAAGARLRARGAAVPALDCVPSDDGRPLLLALRLVMALEEHRSGPQRHRPAAEPVARALSALDRCDRAAMEASLRAAVARCAPATVLVDDAQYADLDSLAVLGRVDAPGVHWVLSTEQHVGLTGPESAPRLALDAVGTRGGEGAADVTDRPAAEGPHAVILPPLGPQDTTALVARWLRASADTALAGRVYELTRGVPGAVEALLTGWTRRGVIRVADGHAFMPARTTVPALPDDDRFLAALDRLGEPARSVAAALSILGPLGRRALPLTASWAGLSAEDAQDGVRRLVEAGIVEELPGPDARTVRGWTFRLPLAAHAVRERLSPVDRSRLSATAVEVLWQGTTDPEHAGSVLPPAQGLLDGTDATAYRAGRVADAGSLVDRERAVAELTAAARQMSPGTDDGRVLRWLRAARDLTEHADARDLVLQQYGIAAYLACDYPTGQAVGEALLRNPGPTLGELDLQEAACLVVAVTANARDWPTMSRLATARWWAELPVPALAKVTGRALALCHLSKWQEAAELLERNRTVWNTGARARATPGVFRAMAELALGRPERYRRELAMRDAPELPPGKVYSLAAGMFDDLLAGYDLDAARTVLATAGLSPRALPPLSRFLHDHLTGRWDQALESARRLLAHGEAQSTPVSDSSLLPARTAAILLARGRITTALQVVEDLRGAEGSPPQCALHASEAEALMTLGDLDSAEETLRAGLSTARAHAQIYGTEELWALLAEVLAGTGRAAEATACLERLEGIAARTGTDRSRLLHLLASARVLRHDAPGPARDHLREAVRLARARALPFETATTLLAAATAGAGPDTLLHEAYEFFGAVDATLWRHHTRTALRAAGLAVPGRSRTTTENDHLLATLVAEGLTNQQTAGVLRLTEDAVAQRLSRLFARTGLRSRTDVVTAVLTRSL
ncbi:AAA family ATPase [Streptomyces sp. NPDC051016]|uniref:AAA family ATPase n=1 Tax=Streptomyces sp. NPDC051016 TaxID=3365638 RepID=UPI00379E39B7